MTENSELIKTFRDTTVPFWEMLTTFSIVNSPTSSESLDKVSGNCVKLSSLNVNGNSRYC